MIGKEGAADLNPRKENAARPRVLAGDQVDAAQDRAGPLGQIGQIADRGGDDVEDAAQWVLDPGVVPMPGT
jgi:hypothetical protein